MTGPSLPELEQQRAQLYQRLAATGNFRPGSNNPTYRRCGKPNCACAQPGHPSHGPRWLWTRSVGGKTRTRQLAGRRRAGAGGAGHPHRDDQAGRLAAGRPAGAKDPGHRGPRVGCGAGHRAEFVSYREKTIDTVLGPVRTRRAWYHYAACGHGLAPRDADLGVASASMSAGFTQTTLDDDGHPARDPQSSSYLATFAPAERFAAWRTPRPAAAAPSTSASSSRSATARPGSGTSPASTSPPPPRTSICITPASTSTTSPPSPPGYFATATRTGSSNASPNSAPATSPPCSPQAAT
jgi:hypothetical protein